MGSGGVFVLDSETVPLPEQAAAAGSASSHQVPASKRPTLEGKSVGVIMEDRMVIAGYYACQPPTLLVSEAGGLKSYCWQPVITFPPNHPIKVEETQTAVSPLLGLSTVAY